MPGKPISRKPLRQFANTSWDPLAAWYDGWVGKGGSHHHQKLAIPALLALLDIHPGEQVLDIGSGQGVLAPYIFKAGGQYTGVELSPRLLELARKHHGPKVRFFLGDARSLSALPGLNPGGYDAAAFLLSIQDMDPLDAVVESLAWALKPGGRVGILMVHPCFRIPRQSGWGWDEGRKLQFRRVDRYLTPLSVPLKPHPGQKGGVSWSFHRPLEVYFNTLGRYGLFVDQVKEIPTYKTAAGERAAAENLANQEIPLFLGIRARKMV